jgi:hypothetical protein
MGKILSPDFKGRPDRAQEGSSADNTEDIPVPSAHSIAHLRENYCGSLICEEN